MPWTAVSFLIGGVAISALPPLNGFASEFVIYSGLFSGQPDRRVWAQVAGGRRRGLAFVGAVSALSITRAFGVVFLGSPRDPSSIEPPHEVSRWMLRPRWRMPPAWWCWAWRRCSGCAGGGLGAAGAGRPAGAPTPPRPARRCRRWARRCRASAGLSGALTRPSRCCGGCARAAARRRPSATSPGAAATPRRTARMQYTGSSFSWDFGRRFRACWCCCAGRRRPRATSRRQLPHHHCPDAVERRLFNVIQHGDESAATCRASCARTIRARLRRRRWWPSWSSPGWSCWHRDRCDECAAANAAAAGTTVLHASCCHARS
jgi:hydrogenase-4 component B